MRASTPDLSPAATTIGSGSVAGSDRSLLDWVRLLRDGWWALVAVIALGAACGVLATTLQSTQYEAEATVVSSSARGFLDPETADGLPAVTDTLTRLVGSAGVLGPAATEYAALAADPATAARRRKTASLKWADDHVQATHVGESSIIKIAAEAPTQSDARDLARATAHALELAAAAVPPRERNRGVLVRGFRTSNSGKVSPSPVRNVLLGGNAGLVLGVIAALLVGSGRRRLRRPEEAAAELGVPLLGTVQLSRNSPVSADAGLAAARARLQMLRYGDEGIIVLLTGTARADRLAEVGEGFARSFAAADARALLVDADLSGQTTSRRLAVGHKPGLGDLLDGREREAPVSGGIRSVSDVIFSVNGTGSEHEIAVLPAGQNSHAVDDLSSHKLPDSFAALRREYDYVVVVAPGLDRPAELIPLLEAVDWAVLLAPRGVQARKLRGAYEIGDALTGRLAGTLMINRG
jgi:tyrosine-protein kinase